MEWLIFYLVIFYFLAGFEEYEKIRALNYVEVDVFLVCFSIGTYKTFERVKDTWIPEVS